MGSPCPRCGNVQPVNWCAECWFRAARATLPKAHGDPRMPRPLPQPVAVQLPCILPAVECPCPQHQRLRDSLPQNGAGCCIDQSLALVEPPVPPRPTPPGVALWNPMLAIGGPR